MRASHELGSNSRGILRDSYYKAHILYVDFEYIFEILFFFLISSTKMREKKLSLLFPIVVRLRVHLQS